MAGGGRGGQDAQGHRDPGRGGREGRAGCTGPPGPGPGPRAGEAAGPVAGGVSHLVALPDGVEVLAGIAEPQRQPRVDAVDGHLRLGGWLFEGSPAAGAWRLPGVQYIPPRLRQPCPGYIPPRRMPSVGRPLRWMQHQGSLL